MESKNIAYSVAQMIEKYADFLKAYHQFDPVGAEKTVRELSSRLGFLGVPTLENKLETLKVEPIIDKKKLLTQYQYRKARDNGMTNKEIREIYRLKHPTQIGGFARQYSKLQKAVENQPTPDPAIPQDSQPVEQTIPTEDKQIIPTEEIQEQQPTN